MSEPPAKLQKRVRSSALSPLDIGYYSSSSAIRFVFSLAFRYDTHDAQPSWRRRSRFSDQTVGDDEDGGGGGGGSASDDGETADEKGSKRARGKGGKRVRRALHARSVRTSGGWGLTCRLALPLGKERLVRPSSCATGLTSVPSPLLAVVTTSEHRTSLTQITRSLVVTYLMRMSTLTLPAKSAHSISGISPRLNDCIPGTRHREEAAFPPDGFLAKHNRAGTELNHDAAAVYVHS